MIKLFRRWWQYLTAKLSGDFEARADPKVQLEQAIREAQDQHRRLKEQAANVIANQKQTELRLNRRMEELEKANGQARQALTMADDAAQKGEADKAEEFTTAAETIATRLIEIEREVNDLKALHLDNARAVEQAKAAVEQNSIAVQEKLTERQKLLGQLDQAKMQEQMNTAMAQLSETVGQDVPTFDEVRDKIEARYAKATGMAELSEGTVENRMLEVERATRSTEAHARLDAMREQLGLSAGETEPAPAAPAEDPPAEG
jgi:phage shock protein A